MSILKKMHNRFLVYLVFALACIRIAAARVWSFAGSGDTVQNATGKSVVRQALRLRLGSINRGTPIKRHYALELAGAFPQVRLASLAARPVPVPLENAALTTAAAGPFDLQLATGPNMLQAASVQHPSTNVIISSCSSCFSCGGCSSCGSCSSCTCSCSSCGSCGSCSSCSCASCGGCSSCFY
jgi:hypothetical protein